MQTENQLTFSDLSFAYNTKSHLYKVCLQDVNRMLPTIVEYLFHCYLREIVVGNERRRFAKNESNFFSIYIALAHSFYKIAKGSQQTTPPFSSFGKCGYEFLNFFIHKVALEIWKIYI